MTDSVLPEGTIVAQRLKVIRALGEGGMGAVYEVEHMLTKHRRALKLLHANLTSQPGVVERFLREASAAGRIGNPHIVETFDAGMTEDGCPYLVMELLQGYSLASHLARRGKLEAAEAVEIFRQVCDGVQAAHESGIVHRDLKPENIFLMSGPRRFVKILDFGISKFDPALTGMSTSTLEGSVLGTPYYMSPEQVRGSKDVDSAADVYALGVVLYECLTGRRPFEAETLPHLAVLIAEGRYAPVSTRAPGLPIELDAIIARALSADRQARYPSARAFAEALDVIVQRGVLGNLVTEFQGLSSIPPAYSAFPHAATEIVPSYGPPPPNAFAGTPAPVERSSQEKPARRASTQIAIGSVLLLLALGGGFAVSRVWPDASATAESATAAEAVEPPQPSPSAAKSVAGTPKVEAMVSVELEAAPAPSASVRSGKGAASPAPTSASPARSAAPNPARRTSEHGLVEDNPFK